MTIPFAILRRAALVTLLGALGACGPIGGGDDASFHLRGVNLITDSPAVKFYLGSTSVAAATFNGDSDWHAAEPGSFNLKLSVIHPANLNSDTSDDAEETDIGTTVAQSFERDKDYTLFGYGTLAEPQVFVVDTTGARDGTPDDNLVVYQVVNASPAAQTVDVYLTAPEASLPTPTLVGTLAPGQTTGQIKLTVNAAADAISDDATRTVDLTIQLKTAGTDTVIYTSPLMTATEQTRLMFAVGDNVGAGASPVKLLEISGTTTTLFQDTNDQGQVRVANVAYGSPPVDVVVGSFQNPIAQSLAFRGLSNYAKANNGEVGMIATKSGDPTSIAFIEEFTALPDQSYTAYAIGTSTDVDATVLADDTRAVPTQAKFRFLTAAPSLKNQAVDIYVLEPDAVIHYPDNDSSTTDTTPQFSSIAYQTGTTYLTLQGGSFDVYVAAAGTERILLGPTRIAVPDGANQTLVLTDNENSTLELIPVTDAATAN